MKHLADRLEGIVQSCPYWTEARYHRRTSQALQVQKGLVKQAKSTVTTGVGIRVLVDGAWGFSSISDVSPTSLEKALKRAVDCAKSISQMKKAAVRALPVGNLARGEFDLPGIEELANVPLKEKLEAVRRAEELTRGQSSQVHCVVSSYHEIF